MQQPGVAGPLMKAAAYPAVLIVGLVTWFRMASWITGTLPAVTPGAIYPPAHSAEPLALVVIMLPLILTMAAAGLVTLVANRFEAAKKQQNETNYANYEGDSHERE